LEDRTPSGSSTPIALSQRHCRPGSESVFVAGDTPTELVSPFGSIANAATIAVLDGKGRVVAAKTIRSPRLTTGKVAPYDWSVYSIAVNEKSRTIYVSYHGPNTSGADSVEIRGRRLIRCAASRDGGVACLRLVHGRIQAFRGGLLATRGTPPTLLLLRAGGAVETEWASGFRNAHLMEFARAGSRVFGLESCPKLGGLTAVDLDRNVARMLASPAAPGTARPRGVCGERIAVLPRDLRLAVAKSIEGLAYLLFVDGRNGRVVATRRVTATPIDVAAVP
jgi:hypothetical protein